MNNVRSRHYFLTRGWVVFACAFFALTGLARAARADVGKGSLAGVLENYFVLDGTHSSVSRSVTYLTSQTVLSPSLRLVAGTIHKGGHDLLDENYLQSSSGQDRLRIGRIRSVFGFSDWSECYYQGYVRTPLVRSLLLSNYIKLNRLDTGVDWQHDSGPFEMTVGVVNTTSRTNQFLPRHANDLILRLQGYTGAFIFGIDDFAGVDGGKFNSDRIFGFDARWTAPHWQVTGEWDSGYFNGQSSRGYYADVLYHPPGLLRTTFVGRAEGISGATTGGYQADYPNGELLSGRRYTLGIKQILTKQYTIEVSRLYGDHGNVNQGSAPWAVQLITFTHF